MPLEGGMNVNALGGKNKLSPQIIIKEEPELFSRLTMKDANEDDSDSGEESKSKLEK